MADIEEIIRASATAEYPDQMADDTGIGDDIAPLTALEGSEEPEVAVPGAAEAVVTQPKVEAKPAVTEPAAKPAKGKGKRQTADEILAEEGIKDRQPSGRVNAIPHPRVKEMMDRSLARRDAIHADEIRTVSEERDSLRRVTSQRDATHELFERDPERFMAAAAEIHPGYRKFMQQAQTPAGEGRRPAAEPLADQDPMPRPDVKLSDGSMTYSLDQLDKRDEWNRRQAVRDAEAKFGERLKPFEEDKKAREEREATNSRRERATQQVGAAQKWPRWTDHEEAIHGVLEANKGRGITLEQAYLHVVVPKLLKEIEGLTVDRAKIKAEVVKELSNAPRVGRVASPAGSRPAAGRTEQGGSPEDRINSVILDSIQNAGLI